MRDRLAARHLALGALDIDMDPLMVARRVGEFVDLLLGDRIPVADPDLLAFIGLQIRGAFDFQHRLLLLSCLFAAEDCFASLAMTSKKEAVIARSEATKQSPAGNSQRPHRP